MIDRKTRAFFEREGLTVIDETNAPPWLRPRTNAATDAAGWDVWNATPARSGPPSTPDRIAGDPYLGSNVSGTIDRYAANPGAELARALAGPTPTGPAPTMFASGDWPLFTSSGLDINVLRWVPWKVRHAAALSTDRSFVMYCVEEGASVTFDVDDLQTPAGADAIRGYFGRIRQWISATHQTPLTDAEADNLFPTDPRP